MSNNSFSLVIPLWNEGANITQLIDVIEQSGLPEAEPLVGSQAVFCTPSSVPRAKRYTRQSVLKKSSLVSEAKRTAGSQTIYLKLSELLGA